MSIFVLKNGFTIRGIKVMKLNKIITFIFIICLIIILTIPVFSLISAYKSSFLDGLIVTIGFIILLLIVLYKGKIKSFLHKLFKKNL